VGFGGVGPNGAGPATSGVEQALADLQGGRMVVTCGRDGVGAQLVTAAEHADAAVVNFMAPPTRQNDSPSRSRRARA